MVSSGSAQENRRLVLPEHLNHYGSLFGGQLLRWVDEVAWIAASLDYPGCRLVTVAMDEVVFRHRVGGGTVLRFVTSRVAVGRTSVRYRVDVFGESLEKGGEAAVFSTEVTQVRIGEDGETLALP